MNTRQTVRKIVILLVTVVPGIIFLGIPTFLQDKQDISESYARNIFPWVSRPFVFLNSLVPISLTEITVVFTALSFLIWIIWLIIRFVHSDNKKKSLYRFVFTAGIVFSVLSMSFILLHGINYTRTPLEKTLSLDSAQRSPEELKEVTVWLAEMTARTREGLAEDEDGCMVLDTGVLQALSDGSKALDNAAVTFPVLSGASVIGKPVALSHYWSFTGITGMYFPFFCEANVNIDVPQSQLPITICHEISHTRGIAREQDANLAGFLGCISSDRQDFQYCAYQYAYLYCAWDLSFADEAAYAETNAMIPDSVRRDWQQNYLYWKQFEGPVQETSTEINNTYLQANLQEEGVRSYDRVTGLIIDYYFTYVKGN